MSIFNAFVFDNTPYNLYVLGSREMQKWVDVSNACLMASISVFP